MVTFWATENKKPFLLPSSIFLWDYQVVKCRLDSIKLIAFGSFTFLWFCCVQLISCWLQFIGPSIHRENSFLASWWLSVTDEAQEIYSWWSCYWYRLFDFLTKITKFNVHLLLLLIAERSYCLLTLVRCNNAVWDTQTLFHCFILDLFGAEGQFFSFAV